MPRNNINRAIRLQQDDADLQGLKLSCPSINFTLKQKNRDAAVYTLEVRVKSIIGLKDNKEPEYGTHFLFKLILSDKYPNEMGPIIQTEEGADIPFHPYFELKEKIEEKRSWEVWAKSRKIKYAVWRDYISYDKFEPLNKKLIRMIHSLQYLEGCVQDYSASNHNEVERLRIVNIEAAKFYEEAKNRGDNTWFPTDREQIMLEDSSKNKFNSPNKDNSSNKTAKFNIKEETIFPSNKPNFQINEMKEAELPKKIFQLQKKVSFSIKEISNAFQPRESSIVEFKYRNNINDRYTANFREDTNRNYYLYFTDSARKEIWKHINYGEEIYFNKVEQGGLMLGNVFKDSSENIIYAVVNKTIRAKQTTASATHLEMTHEVWQQMMSEIDEENKRVGESEDLQIVGWYHTHPNNLEVFMSETDFETQIRFFKEDWQFAVVLNPHRKIWKVFQGANCRECLGYCLEGIPLDIAQPNGEDTLLLDLPS